MARCPQAPLGASRADLVAKADLDAALDVVRAECVALERRLEVKLANAVNRMLLGNFAIAGLLFAALKLFS